ncbi:MAG: MarR family transcriptional regulator [Pseudomonadota bacterium]
MTLSTISFSKADIEIAQLVDLLMRRIHTDLDARSGEFDVARVGPLGGMVLMTLADIEPAPIHRLVELVARDKAQVTRLLQTLGKKGLIDRSNSPDDGRVCVLSLSPKGLETVHGLRIALAQSIDTVLDRLSGKERAQMTRLLRKGLLGQD